MINYQNIPFQLRNIPQWILWRSISNRAGSMDKVPQNAKLKKCNAHDPQNWTTFEEATRRQQAFLADCKINVQLGFTLTRSDPIVCVDLDGCRNPDTGVVSDWAEQFVNYLQSYTEVSPSATGLKIFVCSTDEPFSSISVRLDVEWVSKKEPKLEIYSHKQFMAVTGTVYRYSGLEDRSAQISVLISTYGSGSRTASVDVDFCDNPDADESTIDAARQYLETTEGAISGSGGQNATFAVACRLMIDFALSFEQALELMEDWNRTCVPCWTTAELKHKLIGAGSKSDPRGRRNCASNAAKFEQDMLRIFAESQNLQAAEVQPTTQISNGALNMNNLTSANPSFVSSVITSVPEWPEPLSLIPTVAEEMTADDFPPVISRIAGAVAAHTETPIELPGLMALGVLAASCQRKYEVVLPDGHTEPLNLWVCPTMGPGNRKTAVVTPITKPLREWEYDRRNALKPSIEANNSHRKTMEKRIDHLRIKAAKNNDPLLKEEMLREIRQLELDLPSERYYPTLVTDDCTPEHVAVMLSRNDERMSVISDEGGVFGMMAGRYSRGVPNIEVYLQAHAGSSVKVHRGRRDDIDLRSPCLTLAVSPQPAVLQQIAANTALDGRGLLERILFAMPKSRLGYRSLESHPIPEATSMEWNKLIRSLLDLPQQRDAFNFPLPHRIELTPEAYRLWKLEGAENEFDMRPGNTWGSATAWAAKYPGAVLRIAGLIHVATSVFMGAQPEEFQIPCTVMQSAIRLGKKIKQHSAQAFGLMRLDANQQMAVKVSEWILHQGKTEFTGRDVARALNGGRSNDGVYEALKILTELNWIRPISPPGGQGRPKMSFEVNPRLFYHRQ